MVTNQRVYDGLRDHALAALAAGYTAIVDAAFLRAEERDRIAAVAAEAGVTFLGLWLDAPGDVLAARVAARRRDASDADRAVLRRQLAMDLGPILWHPVDASGDAAGMLAAARDATGRAG